MFLIYENNTLICMSIEDEVVTILFFFRVLKRETHHTLKNAVLPYAFVCPMTYQTRLTERLRASGGAFRRYQRLLSFCTSRAVATLTLTADPSCIRNCSIA